MAKQVTGQAKFQVPGGQATPAPPVGTSLGRFGINLGPGLPRAGPGPLGPGPGPWPGRPAGRAGRAQRAGSTAVCETHAPDLSGWAVREKSNFKQNNRRKYNTGKEEHGFRRN